MRPVEVGKHAGHGLGRRRAAGAHFAEAHHAALFKFGVGVAFISIEREMIGARRLADDKHQNRLLAIRAHGYRPAIHPRRDALERRRHSLGNGRRIAHGSVDGGGRIDHEAHFTVPAHQNRIVLEEGRRDETDKGKAAENRGAAEESLAPPAR